MLALAVTKLPERPAWTYELKFDGYRALGIKANGRVICSLYNTSKLICARYELGLESGECVFTSNRHTTVTPTPWTGACGLRRRFYLIPPSLRCVRAPSLTAGRDHDRSMRRHESLRGSRRSRNTSRLGLARMAIKSKKTRPKPRKVQHRKLRSLPIGKT